LIKSTATAVLASVITKRKQFHSNIIGQSVMLSREEVRNRSKHARKAAETLLS
jgi:hypothetical protein